MRRCILKVSLADAPGTKITWWHELWPCPDIGFVLAVSPEWGQFGELLEEYIPASRGFCGTGFISPLPAAMVNLDTMRQVLFCSNLLHSHFVLYFVAQSITGFSCCLQAVHLLPSYWNQLLHITTPVFFCTWKYNSTPAVHYSSALFHCTSTTMYYANCKVWHQYYSVLQKLLKVLEGSTKYANFTLYYPVLQRTTLYSKVLRQHFSVLKSTTTSYCNTTL